MIIRTMKQSDIDDAAALFYDTVHTVNARDYTERELDAYAPKDPAKLRRDLASYMTSGYALVATIDDRMVGFATMNDQGYLDHGYVHKDHQRQGIGHALLKKRIEIAKELGLTELHCYASVTARPFFERFGFTLIAKNYAKRQGIYLTTYHMRLVLHP